MFPARILLKRNRKFLIRYSDLKNLEKSGFRKNNTVFFIREFLRVIRAKSTASRLFIATRLPHKNCLRWKRNYKNSRDSSIIPEVLRAAILSFRDSKNSEIWFIFLSFAKSQKVRTTWKSFKKEYWSKIPLKIWRSIIAGTARKHFAANTDFEKKSYTDFCLPRSPLVSTK